MFINYRHLKSDLKQIKRDPIIFILYLAPVLLFSFVVLSLQYLPKYLNQYFNLLDYQSYILAGTLALTNGLLGIATGFMMIDDKDGKIYELMQITPLGRKGYLINRLFIPGLMTIVYTLVFTFFLNPLSFVQNIFLIVLCFIQTTLFAIALFHLADDKVKGLTYAKGLNIIIIFVFTKIIDNKALNIFGRVFPTYWLTETIQFKSINTLLIALVVHLIWLFGFVYSFIHRKN